MKLKLFFYLPNIFEKDFDISQILSGNPGIGGTEYITLLVGLSLSKTYNVNFFTKGEIKCDNFKINIIHIDTISECFDFLDNNSYYIVSPIQIDFYKLFSFHFDNFIIWTHTEFCNNRLLIDFAKSRKVKRCIMLTPHSYAKYPLKIRKKSIIIHNPTVYLNTKNNRYKSLTNNIVFLGALVPDRGLDKLVLIMPKLLKKFNDLNIYVCGSSTLYNSEKSQYEDFIRNQIELLGLSDHIILLGNISIKNSLHIFKGAKIGITNIRYKGYETFCLSAVEMGSFGIPVIAGNTDGLKSTLPKKCGCRIKNNKDLFKNICTLLSDNNKNLQYGKNYQKYIQENYTVERCIYLWQEMLEYKKINNHVSCFLIIHERFNELFNKITNKIGILIRKTIKNKK